MPNKYHFVFSGSSVIVKGLQYILDDNSISYIIKDRVESARLAGFGEQINAVEVHVLDEHKDRALLIVKNYQNKINS